MSIKFKATVTFPGEPGEQIYIPTDAPDVECEALTWWFRPNCGRSAGITLSPHTLHLFACETEDVAICGSAMPGFDRALHFATTGKKYKVCLKCRKEAERLNLLDSPGA